ncbi:glycosyltransferase family 2 protein, partial [Methanoregula sp.]|uniref:glycosyltransferase family 2 protein n=1 Tax=Methanoregula sp. TaxID=2052170 RepID=UPI000CBD9E33
MSPTVSLPPQESHRARAEDTASFDARLIKVTDSDVNPHQGLIAVIPAYNEQIALGSVVLQVRQHVDRVIVVDDNSTDKTPEVAKMAGADVIRLHVHTGRAYALLLGLKNAREYGCKAAVYIGPNAYAHIHDIPKVAAATLTGDADLVIGSHYLDVQHNVPFSTEISRTLRKLPKKNNDSLPFTDPMSDIRAFSRRALDKLDFKTDGFHLETDIIAHLQSQNMRVEEAPLTNLSDLPSDPDWKNSVRILAAMPAFNEEKCLAKTIIGTRKFVDTVLVIDDGSTDATKAIAEELGALVIHHENNAGYGAALQDIFQKARELHVDALVILDADGQHNPDDVGRLLDALVKLDVDVVIGSRFLEKNERNIPSYRKVGMKVLDGATRIAGVADISDSQSGFRAYGKRAIDVINLNGQGMSAGSEILIQISDHNLRIAEVPINVRYDIEDT